MSSPTAPSKRKGSTASTGSDAPITMTVLTSNEQQHPSMDSNTDLLPVTMRQESTETASDESNLSVAAASSSENGSHKPLTKIPSEHRFHVAKVQSPDPNGQPQQLPPINRKSAGKQRESQGVQFQDQTHSIKQNDAAIDSCGEDATVSSGNLNNHPGAPASPTTMNADSATEQSVHTNANTNTNYDSCYFKSFRRMTKDRLPRMSYYRDVRSIHNALDRPTLEDLHNPFISFTKTARDLMGKGRGRDRDHATMLSEEAGQPSTPTEDNMAAKPQQMKLGWIQGVLVRCLLNIWGVILFIRLGWVVGQSGILCAVLIILLASTVTIITTLSMSAICTNGEVKAGGTYYMISRSLGPQFGGAIGVIFSLANAVAVALYIVGFCETLVSIFKSHGWSITGDDLNDIRVIGVITAAALLGISLIGMEWESKVQLFLLVILLLSMFDFMLGTVIPAAAEQKAQGFFNYHGDIFMDNLLPRYTDGYNFVTVFAIFFPAATGILAGANISGDLSNPSKSIPKGTLLAIGISTFSYILFAVLAGSTVLREANGEFIDIEFVRNCSLVDSGKCNYGLLWDKQIMKMVSFWGPVIYAGIFAATLSSALASLVSAPKVFQALCKDRLFPYIHVFEKGFGASPEPHRAYFLTFFIAVGGILIGKLDLIAPLISNFFLAAYCLINASCFHASISRMPGFRPSFKYYNKWVSLVGSCLSFAIMMLSDWITAVLTVVLIIFLYAYLHYRKPDVNWGSSTQSESYIRALKAVEKLSNIPEHVKTYRPQILLLCGRPAERPALVDFAQSITKKISLLVCGQVIVNPPTLKAGTADGSASQRMLKLAERQVHKKRANEYLQNRNIKAFFALKEDDSFSKGAKGLMEITGVGQLKPNLVLMGWKSDWKTASLADLDDYVEAIHYAFDLHMSFGILRLPDRIGFEEYASQIEHLSDLPMNNIYSMYREEHPHLDYRGSIRDDSNAATPQSTPVLNRAHPLTKNPSSFLVATSPNGGTGSESGSSGLGSEAISTFNKVKNSFKNNNGRRKSEADMDKKWNIAPEGEHEPEGAKVVVDIPAHVLNAINQFSRKQKRGTIDVWWLYDDGGLTILIPHLLSLRSQWKNCQIRIFTLANKKDELDRDKRNMATLLSKFRIDFSTVTVIADIQLSPKAEYVREFDSLIEQWVEPDESDGEQSPNTDITVQKDETGESKEANEKVKPISQSELLACKDKTNRHIRLRELLQEHSKYASLIVMTLSVPRRNTCSSPLFLAWLDTVMSDLPPFLFIRGNQTSVLTFYS